MQFLEKINQQLKGKKCWRVWDGVPPAIFLEFGKTSDQQRGEYSLCVMGANWHIEKNGQIITTSANVEKEDVIRGITMFEGQTFTKLLINRNTQKDEIKFSGELVLVVDRNNDGEWSIISPFGECEIVGSGKRSQFQQLIYYTKQGDKKSEIMGQ